VFETGAEVRFEADLKGQFDSSNTPLLSTITIQLYFPNKIIVFKHLETI
jgi:hypothetical protein